MQSEVKMDETVFFLSRIFVMSALLTVAILGAFAAGMLALAGVRTEILLCLGIVSVALFLAWDIFRVLKGRIGGKRR